MTNQMKPLMRFNAIVISISTLIVFGLWYEISALILQYPDWFTNPSNKTYNWIGVLLTGLTSIGIYRIIYTLTAFVINNCKKIKELVFSSYYLEGTWIGFYIGVLGKERYFIETFEQNLDGIVIKGIAYDENSNLHSFWTSESINLDATKGEISYQYKVRSTKEKTDPNGIAYFSFIRDNNKKPCSTLVGFSADSHLTKKCKAMEYMFSRSTKYDINEALKEAHNFYKGKKDFVYNIEDNNG